ASSDSVSDRAARSTMGNWFGNLRVSVAQPWWLLLLVVIIPPLIWFSFRSLAGLGPVRRAIAILFRTAVITLIVLALAELQMVPTNDRLTTLFLLDFSQSVPREYQEFMVGLAQESSRRQRRSDDLAGLIVFGKSPRVEVPPGPSDLGVGSPENPVDG